MQSIWVMACRERDCALGKCVTPAKSEQDHGEDHLSATQMLRQEAASVGRAGQ